MPLEKFHSMLSMKQSVKSICVYYTNDTLMKDIAYTVCRIFGLKPVQMPAKLFVCTQHRNTALPGDIVDISKSAGARTELNEHGYFQQSL